MKYRPDIDGLRAVAVAPVVLYHAGFSGTPGGFVGVDVFFVISGFLITSIVSREISDGRFSLVSFYERRARRILPALLATIIVSFAIGWFVLLPAEMKSLGQSAFATALFLSNVYFTITLDYFARAADYAPLLHTWSLAVEEQFYLFFPPLLMLIALRRWGHAFWIVFGISLLSFVAAVAVLPTKPDWVFYLIFFRAWELGAGAMLALAAPRPPHGRVARELLAVASMSAILIPVFAFHSATPFPAAAAVPPVLGATVLIWIGAQGGGSIISGFLSLRALVWLGLISYSLYLVHWPILAFLRIVLDTTDLPFAIATAAVTASLVIAWLSFRFVEKPFRLPPSKSSGRTSVLAGATVSLVSVAVVGLIFHVSEGLPGRLPVSVTAAAAFADDRNARRGDCFGRSPSEGLCSIGAPRDDDGQVDFLFWGDSHADAFMPGVEQAARLAGQNGVFAGRSACPPILDIQRVSTGRPCTAFNEHVRSWLDDRDDVSLVILGARWTLSVEGTRYAGEAGSGVRLEWIGGSDGPPTRSGNAALVEAGLNATVAEISAPGREVVLLGPVPEVGRNVPASIARHALLGLTPPAAVTRQAYEARAGETERILMRVAEAYDSVRFVPLSDLFCDSHLCRTTNSDGEAYYVDDDHISQTAALNLLPPRLKDIWHRTLD